MYCTLSQPTITVGQKMNLVCKPEDSAFSPTANATFSIMGSNPAYTLEFLGPAVIAEGSFTQEVTSYRVGNHELRQLKVKIDDKEYLISPISFQVTSVIQQDQIQGPGQAQQPTPFPIVDPIKVPAPWWWWVLWGLGALILLAFMVVKVRKWLQEQKDMAKMEAESKPLTPEEKFKTRMRKLDSQGFHMRGEYKTFALELTNILKNAIGDQFKIQAEELTSEELILILQERYRKFYQESGNLLRAVLSELDQIKFAKIETSQERCFALLDQSSQIGSILFGEFK